MKKTFRFVMGQLNFLVGDIEANTERVIEQALIAKNELQADLIIFPELALTGYPPEDLLFRKALYERVAISLEKIKKDCTQIDILLGYPQQFRGDHYNAASLISHGKIIASYQKKYLPNYSVFDEVRYFKPGIDDPIVINYQGLQLGFLICEDLWHSGPLNKIISAGAELIISLNASPFDTFKYEARITMLQKRVKQGKVPILYVNCIGGQDELVFDGGSLVVDPNGMVQQQGPFCQECLVPVDFSLDFATKKIDFQHSPIQPVPSQEERVYQALVLGVKDYIGKNHFPGAVLGLSGGIDSALTLAIAVDALGSERVEAVLMPSRYTAAMSIEDALEEARALNVRTTLIPIEKIFTASLESLQDEFKDLPRDITEENLQARCRGMILMAISNKKGSIVLATGNKSEMAVGYSTLYGDMAGGFCVLKDIPKTLIYRLVAYRNSLSPVVPTRVINREPTAELAPDQKDQDSLPPYPILDKILELYIEKDKCYQDIVEMGYDKVIVKKVILMVDKSEYKRRQAPLGVRITSRAFGRDRRYPITSGYNRYLLKD